MQFEILRAGIESARTVADVGRLRQDLSRGFSDGAVAEADAETLFEALDALQERLGPKKAKARPLDELVTACRKRRSIYPERVYQRIPDREKARARRYQLAMSGPLPPHLAAPFTVSQLAILRIVADDCAKDGACTDHVEALAARAGTCRRNAQYALRDAERAGLIVRVLRPRHGEPNDTNVLTIANGEWQAWIEQGRRPGPKGRPRNFAQNFAPLGQGSNPEPLVLGGTEEMAAERRQAEPVREDPTPRAEAEATAPESGGAMLEDHALVRPDEHSPSTAAGPEKGPKASSPHDPRNPAPPRRSFGYEGAFTLGPEAQRLMEMLEASRAQAEAASGPDPDVPPSMRGTTPGDPGGLPGALEAHRHGLAPGAAEPLLMAAGCHHSGGHDGSPVEAAGNDEGAAPEAGGTLGEDTGGDEPGRNLGAILPQVAESGGPGDGAAEGHRVCLAFHPTSDNLSQVG